MKSYAIDTDSSYEAVDMLRFISNTGVEFRKAILNLDFKKHPFDIENSEEWPLIFECHSNKMHWSGDFQIRIRMLTCGYGEEGPHDLVECLYIAGFKGIIDEEEIFTKKKILRTYQK